MTVMPGPQMPNVTARIANLLPIGAAIVAIALGWGEMKNQMASEQKFREEAFKSISAEVSRMSDTYDKLEHRIRGLEEQGARTDERFTLILTLMTELKSQVASLTEDRIRK